MERSLCLKWSIKTTDIFPASLVSIVPLRMEFEVENGFISD